MEGGAVSKFDLKDLEGWARPQSHAEKAQATEARDFVADRLSHLSEGRMFGPPFDIILQGSRINDTAVAGSSDVDVAVVTNNSREHPDLLGSVGETYDQLVRNIWTAFPRAVVGTFAIRTSDFSSVAIDIVPAVHRECDGDIGFVVPGGTDLSLCEFECWPSQHSAAVHARDCELHGRLRPVVRALKGLRDFRHINTGYPEELPSYLLESLAVAAPDTVYSGQLSKDVPALIEWAEESVRDHERRLSLDSPDGRSSLFAEFQKWTPATVVSGLVELSYVFKTGDAFGTWS